MPYTVRLSDDKNHDFLEKFFHFFGVCRLGYSKPPLCKGFKCELFTNHLPRKGMETRESVWTRVSYRLYKPLAPKGDGNTCVGQVRVKTFTLQTTCPERRWKRWGGNRLTHDKTLYKPLAPKGDGNIKETPTNPATKFFTNHLPRKGMETLLFRYFEKESYKLYKPLAPKGDENEQLD
ncbi:hypothetical protein [Calothrix sp. CCY 0018]|uniref:hypothetical protein n=1 Tax=Calothrix sp. CCY 0018 TaxID=3103864 RepID=UPI0039C6DD68